MAISFVAAGAVQTGANPTVPVPAGYQQGDLLVIVTAGSAAPTTPSGWTQNATTTGGGFLTILSKFATGSESSVAVTISGSGIVAVMFAYRGVSAFDTISAFSTVTSGTTVATNTLTTSYNNEYVTSVYCSQAIAGTWTSPASTTSRVNSAGTASARGLLIVDELQAAAGVSTSRTATYSATSNLTGVSFSIIPSGRYWVGGTGTWDTTTKTNWSFSSGGSSGAPVPTAQDNVAFDQAGTYTVTCTGALTCNDITVTTGTVTFAAGTTPTFTVSGSMSLVAGTVWSAGGALTFNATSTGKTITTNGTSISANGITFNGVGGVWTLGSAFTSGTGFTVTNGTLDTSASNYSISVTSLTINGGTINLNASTLTVNSSSVPFTYTSGTFNAGTSQITCSGAVGTFAGGGLTFYNVSFTGAGVTATITGANTFNNFSVGGKSSAGTGNVTLGANQTINGTLTVSAGTDATCRMFIKSDTIGTTRTLTCAAFSATDVDFRDITMAGAAAPVSGTRLGDAKGNSGITFPAPKTVYWNLAGGSGWSATAWALSAGGAVAVNNFPLAQDTAIITSTSPPSGSTITFAGAYNVGTVDMSARTSNTLTVATGGAGVAPALYGDWINGTGVTFSAATGPLVFAGRGSQKITSAGATFTQPITLNSPSGTFQLQDALTTSSATAGAFTLTNGTIDLNGKTLTISGTGATFLTGAGTKNITFNGGTIVISSSGTNNFNNAQPTGFTTTAGTGTGTISLTSASAKQFVGGGSTYNCTLNQGGAGALTIAGNGSTFNNITNTYSATGATTITLNAATVNTVSFTASGASGKLLTINSATAGSSRTLTLTGGGTVSVDYLSVQDIAFTPAPATDGTTPYVWYLGANSTNSGNNTGGLFQAGGVGAIKVYQITNTATTTWTVPSDWNSSSNTIHLIGAGGGGASGAYAGSNGAAGGGGGGGGYTVVTNYSTTPSSSISVAVGIAGAANTDGGNTTWASGAYTAGGGKKGTATPATPTSAGGAGGTGTFAGGAGGAGAFSTIASNYHGGGGAGGAGGPNGVGGAGGIGFATTTAASVAGGGGGGNGGGSAGGNASSATGGTGGNNFGGTGGGATNNAAGTFGGGGAGGVNTSLGGSGGSGIDILNTIGGAGGKGGGSSINGTANAGLYGGGGAGGGAATPKTGYLGGAGSQGLIVIAYTPSAVVANTSNFFNFFPL